MITSENREAGFRKALDELLDAYGADLTIEDDGRAYFPVPVVEISMNAKYDDNGDLTHQYVEFNIRG